MFDRKSFSSRLVSLRKAKEATREELACALDLSYYSVAKMETGERACSIEVLYALSDYFGVTIDYLVGKSDFPDYTASEDTTLFPFLQHRIKALREERGLDIYAMADLVEETPRNYAGYEAGEVLPRLRMICALADFFSVSLDYLVGRSDDPEMRQATMTPRNRKELPHE